MKPVPAPNRILLARTDRIGDVVLSLPAATMIRRCLPGAEVHFLTRAYTAPLAEMAPEVGAVLVDRGGGAWGLSRELKAGSYDAAVLLHPTARLAAALFLARIPVRIGTAYRSYGFLLNRRVPLHRRESPRHELELNLEMVRRGLLLKNGDSDDREYHPKLIVGPEQRAEAKKAIGPEAENLVVVHPGSGGSARDWPPENFAGVAGRLAGAGFGLAITLGPGEESLRGRLEGTLPSGIRWISGLDLGRLAAVLSLARLVVSNSTGPLHIATAVGARALGIYCPVKPCLPRRWGPYGPGHAALVPEVPSCDSCTGKACPHWDCMGSLTVESVFAKALEMLKKP